MVFPLFRYRFLGHVSFFLIFFRFGILLDTLDGDAKFLARALDVLEDLAGASSCRFIAFFELFVLSLESFEFLFQLLNQVHNKTPLKMILWENK